MAWRFVRQPNGLLARFSDIVDDFTHYNMSPLEALNLCRDDHGMPEDAAKVKVQGGTEDWLPWTVGVKGSGLDRWTNFLETIRIMHGSARAIEIERVFGGLAVAQ